MTRRLALVLVVGLAVLGGVLFASSHAAAGPSPSVSIASVQGNVGGQVTATLHVNSVPPGGATAWQMDVSWSGGAASVVSCNTSGSCNTAAGPSTARFVGSNISGVGGGGQIGSLTFRCNAPGTVSTSVSGAIVGDSAGNEYAAAGGGGSVTCVQAQPTNTPRPQPTNTPRPRATNTPRPAAPTDTPRPGFPTNTPPPVVAQATDTPRPGETPATATRTPEATATGETTPTPTTTVTSEVLGVATPGNTGDGGGSGDPVRQPPSSQDLAASVRPQTTSAVLEFGDVSTDPEVIATNLVLAIILLIIMLVASGLFNDTIDQNREELSERLEWLLTPMYAIGSAISWVAHTIRLPVALQRVLAPTGIILLCGLIYSLNEPPSFDETGLLLFVSLIISIAVLTYIFEGGMAIMSRERYHVPSGVKAFPLAILIAVGFVALSRAVNFEAPIMFGFVAVATALAATKLRDNEEALTAAIPTTILLAVALIAWGALGLLRDAASDSTAWYASLPSETSAMIFAGGIEGVLFAMTPVQFSDGYPIWKSLRWWWVLLAGTSAFVFTWALLNPAAKYVDAMIQGRVLTAIGLTVAYAVAVVAIWGYFTLRARSRGGAASAG